MADTPKVTLLVPAFNEPEDILEQSLSSVMAQTFTDFECIVVDESTRPEAAQACERICARDPRFRYVHPTERLGLPAVSIWPSQWPAARCWPALTPTTSACRTGLRSRWRSWTRIRTSAWSAQGCN